MPDRHHPESPDIRLRNLGPDHPNVAIAANTLAWLYRATGRYAEAEPLFEHALISTLHVPRGCEAHAWIQKTPSEATNARASSSGMITGPRSPGAPQASRRHHST